MRLLQESGPTAVTTRGVADAAGVQPPAIYRLFGDKNGLLDAVAEQVLATSVAAKAGAADAAAATGDDPLTDLRDGWRTQVEFGVANPDVFRLLSDPERLLRSPAARRGLLVLEARVHRLAVAGRLRVPEPRAVGLIQVAGTGAVLTLLSTPAAERDPGLADAVLEAVLQQILTEPAVREDDPVRAATIAFRAVAEDVHPMSSAERGLLLDWLDRAIDRS